jgi:RNA polymerase sigma factor (sigma-70 family)
MDDDKTLVAAARRGDDSAWGVIYDRYGDKLHDHCHRILRDRDEAADALHDAFLAASRNLHQLRDPDRLRPWLYSICRHTSLRRLRARDRVELTDAPDDMTAPDHDLDRGVRAEELGELVWAAAAGLSPRDQALLDLSVRQGLEGQDLADAMGTSLSNSYVMVSRMRDQVERSIGALLIARLGREDCKELSALLAGWDGTFSPLLRKRVARHVDGCEVCSEKRKTVASPMALLAAVPILPAPAALRGRIISSVRNWEVYNSPPIKFTAEGFAALQDTKAKRRVGAAWIPAVAAVLLLLGGLFLAGRGDGPSALETAADSRLPERELVTTTTASTTTTTIAGDPSTSTSEGSLAPPATDSTGATVTTRPGGSTSTTQKPADTTTTTVHVEVTRVTFSPATVTTSGCATGATTSTITATVAGSPRKVRVVPSQGSIVAMTPNGDGTYTAQIGPYANPGDVQFVVQAYNETDQPGKKIGTLHVAACPPPPTVPTNHG